MQGPSAVGRGTTQAPPRRPQADHPARQWPRGPPSPRPGPTPRGRRHSTVSQGPTASRPSRPRKRGPAASSSSRSLAAGLIGEALWAWPRIVEAFTTVSTDDAYVAGHVTYVASRVPGTILKVHVDDNEFVDRGKLLVELDPEPYQVAADRAAAAVAVAQAQFSRPRPRAGRSWPASGRPITT